ncbi:unnamed protein product, partial [Rotaria magnacalcarata]
NTTNDELVSILEHNSTIRTLEDDTLDNNESCVISKDDFNLTRGKRFQFGQGIYTAPDINVAEKYARQFSYQNERYLVVSQNRVNPATLIKISADQTGVMEYWINPSDQDVRPYGVCIRKI